MPLIEVVKTPKTTDEALCTAMVTAAKLRKNAVITADTPGFVVNRVLAKLLGEAMHAVEQGTPFETSSRPCSRSACRWTRSSCSSSSASRSARTCSTRTTPRSRSASSRATTCTSSPSTAASSRRTARARSRAIDKKALAIVAKHRPADAKPLTAAELQLRVEDGLADEIKRMLDDTVVEAAEDIDLCMILGAGWPFQMGGVTPYLDRVGASERVFGDTFHHPTIRGVS